jgi:S-adenosylmethionine hydrolase
MSVIALMTDFGTSDHYVPAMKGMILQINPNAQIVDISHEIHPHDLFHGAFVLRQTLPYFPAGTIFVAVVDPTVGSNRPIIAARYSDRIVLAPDNGLISLLHRDAHLQEIHVVEQRRLFASTLSPTFHGRDIFAPVAAHLSLGTALDQVGPPADHVEVLGLAKPTIEPDGAIRGQVVLIDHFGNLTTNISGRDLTASRRRNPNAIVKVGSVEVGPVRTTYADVEAGQPVAVMGSADMLEIAVNSGNAAEQLNARPGDPVRLT